jgi:predicted NAD/FAD-dependent oxidoreductase
MREPGKIAIIGAGMAGLSAARQLRRAGMAVTLFDKGRRAGGRLATRYEQGFTFNHGCQFFTARDAGFAAEVKAFSAPWPLAGDGRFAGVPDMAAIASGFSNGLDVRQSAHLRRWVRGADGWRLHFDDAVAGPFSAVILAIPAPQAAALLNEISHPFAAALKAVRLAPCWAVMLGFDAAMNGPETERREDGPLSWLARENSRPGAAAGPAAYMLHAGAQWSEAHLEDRPEDVIAALTAAAPFKASPVFARAHRWRYALAQTPLGQEFLWDEPQGLGICGDWCLGGRLEAAYLSGRALGIRLTA